MQCDIQNTGVQFNSSNNNKKTQIKKGDHISVLNFSQPCSEAVFSPVHKISIRFIFSTTLNLNLVSLFHTINTVWFICNGNICALKSHTAPDVVQHLNTSDLQELLAD